MKRNCPHCNKEGIQFQEHALEKHYKLKTDNCLQCNKEVTIPNHAAWIILFLSIAVALFLALAYLFQALFSPDQSWFSSWTKLLLFPITGYIFISFVFNFLYQRFVPIQVKK